jgi:predicted Zn-dependent protease
VVVASAALLLPAQLLVSPARAASVTPHESATTQADNGVTCSRPESDAEALVILNNYYPNKYIWDHTDLTVAIQAHPSATQEQLDAIHRAIATWDSVLRSCFDGLITLTDVTGSQPSPHRAADIVVHYVPTAGGVVFGGYAICGAQGCPNILVRSDLPPSLNRDPYSPEYLYYVTLHELGHALGLGHATNLYESTDLMGYGWNSSNGITPVLSQCDVDALAYIWSWALNGTEPAPAGPGPYDCSQD